MTKRSTVDPALVPGHARIVVQIYNPETRSYGQPAGFSMSRIPVRTRRELDRMWKRLQDVADGRDWTDARHTAAKDAEVNTTAAP